MGKHKNGTCMADGGITQETPEQLMARIQAKYNVSGNLPPAPVPQPMAQPALQPAPQTQASGQGILSLLKGRGAQIDKAVNGYANGGIVKGKGTPTSDDVPVKIKGRDYNLSDTEVVLPSKTRQALGEMLGAEPGNVAQANDPVEKYIEQTNGKPPVDVKEGTSLADGGLLDDEARKMDYQAVTGIAAPSPIPAPVAAPAVKPLDTSSGPTVSDGAGGVYTPESGSRPGANILSGIASLPGAVVNVFKDSAQAARGDKSYEQIRAERAAGPAVTNGQPNAGQPMNSGQNALKVDAFGANPDRFPVPANGNGSFTTGKAQYDETGLNRTGMATPDSSGGGFTQKGVSYNVNPSNQEGITKITSTKTNPLYTNIRPEDATAGLKNQMVGGDPQEGLARHARANAITQSIIDKQPQGGVGILNDPNNVDAANAEKTARWRQDDLIAKSRSLPAAGQLANTLAQGETQGAIEASRSATAQRGQDITSGITARGQDLTAKTESGRQAAESPLKQAQAEGIMAQTDSARMLADLQKKALAGDAQAAASYRALTGKGGAPASDRYMTVQGGEEIGPDGMTKIKRPGGVFDAQTGQFVPMNGGQQQGQANAPKAGEVRSGYKFKGGNPADQTSWEKV